MESRKMTAAQWIAVNDNPRQRDTAAHAIKASRGHLKAPSPVHQRVHAAQLPGGMLVKLDGHTRAMLWSDGRLAAPDVVFCDIHHVSSMDEAKALYETFDGKGAGKTARDNLSGAFREAGMVPESGLLQTGAITSALRHLAPGGTPIYSAVKMWRPELEALDALGVSSRLFIGGVILGALAVLRVRGERAHAFLSAVAVDGGIKTADGSDGVDAICRYIKDRNNKLSGEPAIMDVGERCITACEGYLAGKLFSQAVRRSDIGLYLSQKSNKNWGR